MDSIKEAFQKVKQDIEVLSNEMNFLKESLLETREKLIEVCGILQNFNEKLVNLDKSRQVSTQESRISTIPTHNPTFRQEIEGLKTENSPISTGNEGVPTDRQTDQQTDIYKGIHTERNQEPLENALEILNSLDNLKKELRLKFKRLTEQEILVFSTIYQLEEENGYADYKSISVKLHLSESSVRDYVLRIIKKGVSIDKKRVNNKVIHLFISQNIKKIASLSTIIKLRDL